MQEYEQAGAAYRRAADIDAGALPAWQGLAELASERDQPEGALEAYGRLAELAEARPGEDPVRGKLPGYLRRAAEAATRLADWPRAEALCQRLLGLQALPQEEQLEVLCLLADVQLKADHIERERLVKERLAAAGTSLLSLLLLLLLLLLSLRLLHCRPPGVMHAQRSLTAGQRKETAVC